MKCLTRRWMYLLTPQLTIYKNIAPYVKGKHVLEIGFGNGAGVVQYYDAAERIVGIEKEDEYVELANTLFPLDKVSFEKGDICAETLGLYDVIVMIEVIEHIEDWQEALKNCHARLHHDGVLIVSTPNANGTFVKNALHGDEWTAVEFYENLKEFFSEVTLHDFSLDNPQGLDTRITPLVAVCRKRNSS